MGLQPALGGTAELGRLFGRQRENVLTHPGPGLLQTSLSSRWCATRPPFNFLECSWFASDHRLVQAGLSLSVLGTGGLSARGDVALGEMTSRDIWGCHKRLGGEGASGTWG